MKYFVYWTEDRRDNEKSPSVWNCVIKNDANQEDIAIVERYNNFISSVTNNKISVGYTINTNGDTLDSFVKDQNFYNDIIDDNIPNNFSKYEFDNPSFVELMTHLNNMVDYYENLSRANQARFVNVINEVLTRDFYYPNNKTFIRLSDLKVFIAQQEAQEQESKKRRKIRKKQEKDDFANSY